MNLLMDLSENYGVLKSVLLVPAATTCGKVILTNNNIML